MDRPKLFERGGFNAILDCGYAHNQWLEMALAYLPEDLLKNTQEKLLFISTASRDACRVARCYCRTREVILLSERILPGSKIQHSTDQKARYFIYVVLHEVAHAIKKHKIQLFDDLSEEEDEGQEIEADDLAMKWFNDHVKKMNNVPPITREQIKSVQEAQQEAMEKLKDGI